MSTSFIRAHVSGEMLAKVTRLFNGSTADIVTELLQNARRADATRVQITTTAAEGSDVATLRVADDG